MMDISYILNELGEERENYYSAVAPPIMQTSNFIFNSVDEMRKAFANEYATGNKNTNNNVVFVLNSN